ncbi:hypothetical protein PHLCEN_2v5598 [Hermanssonia centrifuga]|uniref:Uncharacterized protein n=1 Tax=Hermanssonia centrifuga TaxID=98765 RepID=A0A2R6P204_9APHY|nr:hypothetical protein PHLCEN_2v5598 [Hermanssonia centrifuga]
MNDEICVLVRRIVPAIGDGHSTTDNSVTDPFEHAHLSLRRCLEQATAADPCVDNGLHLTRIRGPVGTILHAQSDVRSYSAPGESLRTSVTGPNSPWTNPRPGPFEMAYSSTAAATVLGSDIADSGWMSWM